MGKYVEQNLTKDEKVMYKGKLHWIIFFHIWSLLTYFIWAIIKLETSEFVITTKRIIVKTGWISLKTAEFNIQKIEAINVDQGIIGRIFGYGSVIIVGTGGSPEIIPRIKSPVQFRNAFQQLNG